MLQKTDCSALLIDEQAAITYPHIFYRTVNCISPLAIVDCSLISLPITTLCGCPTATQPWG